MIFVNHVKSSPSVFFSVAGTSANDESSSDTVKSPLMLHFAESVIETESTPNIKAKSLDDIPTSMYPAKLQVRDNFNHLESQHAAETRSTLESSLSLSTLSCTDTFSKIDRSNSPKCGFEKFENSMNAHIYVFQVYFSMIYIFYICLPT